MLRSRAAGALSKENVRLAKRLDAARRVARIEIMVAKYMRETLFFEVEDQRLSDPVSRKE